MGTNYLRSLAYQGRKLPLGIQVTSWPSMGQSIKTSPEVSKSPFACSGGSYNSLGHRLQSDGGISLGGLLNWLSSAVVEVARVGQVSVGFSGLDITSGQQECLTTQGR